MGPLSRMAGAWAVWLALVLLCPVRVAQAQAAPVVPAGFEGAVEYLCTELLAGGEPDPDRLAPVIAHVRAHPNAATGLPRYQDAPGAYRGFPIGMPMQRLLRYLYNPQIPQEVIKPFSIRSSVWTTPGADEGQRALWAAPWPPAGPVVVRGEQYDRTTPDPSTGGCYGMTLRRAVILLPAEGAVLSVSVQPEESEVGTKGYALGRDGRAGYVYSDETGLTRAGLGWVSSRIQANVSIGVHVRGEGGVVSGVFQWMRAGWSGLSVVREKHVAESLERYARLFPERLGRLPAPEALERLHAAAAQSTDEDLRVRAREMFACLQDRYGQEAPGEAIRILRGGYESRLDRGELVALRLSGSLEDADSCANASAVRMDSGKKEKSKVKYCFALRDWCAMHCADADGAWRRPASSVKLSWPRRAGTSGCSLSSDRGSDSIAPWPARPRSSFRSNST